MTIDLNVAMLNLLMRSHHDNRFKQRNKISVEIFYSEYEILTMKWWQHQHQQGEISHFKTLSSPHGLKSVTVN
jgi:hypothetical protein